MEMNPNGRQVGGDHYQESGREQHWDFTWRNNYNQFEYCITKYVARCHRKNGIQDLEKALHHLEKFISVTSKFKPTNRPGLDARLWANNLDPCQHDIIESIHIGYLDGARMALVSYIKLLQHNETNPPREYVTGGD